MKIFTGEKHQLRKESLVSIRQHKKDGDDNSRSAKYEKKRTPTQKNPNPKQTVNPGFYFPKKNKIHTVKYRNIYIYIYIKKNVCQCLH